MMTDKKYEAQDLGSFPLKADIEYNKLLQEHEIKRVYISLGNGVEITIPNEAISEAAWKVIWDKLGFLPPVG